MGRSRSRSRSPARRKRAKERDRSSKRRRRRSESRDRRRPDSRERVRHRASKRERSRSRSRSHDRRHSPYPSSSTKSEIPSTSNVSHSSRNISEAEMSGKTPDEIEMMKIMGFCGFETTKGKKVEGNNAGEVHVILKRKYRQYMNRKGGFNRPLDFVA